MKVSSRFVSKIQIVCKLYNNSILNILRVRGSSGAPRLSPRKTPTRPSASSPLKRDSAEFVEIAK